ncbi:hypothetical protein P43SY_006128 [Pythium insidiosum]|uniref:Phospholipid:diacylglycerol acyltransferase n=1 Tax=Pythium insidiosum TaxID=114742 RepID=A0AAD5LJ23_PYTIN|nr:hypothetical protein P43SY_006128 [Pythium insidiosum]
MLSAMAWRWLVVAALVLHGASAATRPVVLIPGFASSQLVAWKKHACNHTIQRNLYRDVNVGDRIWLDATRVLAQSDCWLRCMRLDQRSQADAECRLRAAEGLAAISELDPGLVTGPLSTIWRGLTTHLVEHFALEPSEIVVATYDWRLPPSRLQERDQFFLSLKQKIEHAVATHASGGGLVVIAHSMGNNVFRYFLAWLRHEVGRNHWRQWIDRHVAAFFAIGAPLLGSPEALELITSGLSQGLPVAQSEMRKLVVTFGSILSFLPIPSTPRTSHDLDVIVSVRYQSPGQQQSVERNYTSVDIASGAFFHEMAAHDPVFGELEMVKARFYNQDDVLDAFVPWERPPIQSVYAVYGINLPTKYNFRYQSTDRVGHWYQLSLENESGSHRVCGKTGDQTVPYHSLSWAHSWLGPSGTLVDITRVPQSVYFATERIKRVKALREASTHHADYLHSGRQRRCCRPDASEAPSLFDGLFGKSRADHITFFETSRVEQGQTWTTGVWEIEGAGHRDILSSQAFLRELRAELRHVFEGLSASADKSARPPALDSDCYWNYRQARCEFPDFCEYRYAFGDVTLDQSCRLRQRVAAGHTPSRAQPVSNGSRAAVESAVDPSARFSMDTPGYCAARCVYCARSQIEVHSRLPIDGSFY